MEHPAAHKTFHREIRISTLRAERIAAGVCAQCGAPDLATLRVCAVCAEQHRQAHHRYRSRLAASGLEESTRAKRRELGLCLRCGALRDTTHMTCSQCAKDSKEYRETDGRALHLYRMATGVCRLCEAPVVEGTGFCAGHQAKARAHSLEAGRRMRRRRLEARICTGCKAPSLPGTTQCAYHHVYNILTRYQAKAPDPAFVHLVLDKFTGYCAYTGAPIDMGITGELEHVYPKRHFPDLVAEPSNLVWAHAVVNEAKADMCPDDPLLGLILKPEIVQRIRDCAALCTRRTSV